MTTYKNGMNIYLDFELMFGWNIEFDWKFSL